MSIPTYLAGKPTNVRINGISWGENVNFALGENYTLVGVTNFDGADLRETVVDSSGGAVISRIVGVTDSNGNVSSGGTFNKKGSFTYTYLFGHTESGVWYANSSAMQFQITVGGAVVAPISIADTIYAGVYNDPNHIVNNALPDIVQAAAQAVAQGGTTATILPTNTTNMVNPVTTVVSSPVAQVTNVATTSGAGAGGNAVTSGIVSNVNSAVDGLQNVSVETLVMIGVVGVVGLMLLTRR